MMLETISLHAAKAIRWRSLIAEQSASGKSICQFCVERQINHHTFRYWRAKFVDLKVGLKKERSAQNLPSRFISVSREDFKSTPRIVLPNGVTIDLGVGLDSNSVNQFLLNLCGVGLSGGTDAKS